MSYEDTYLESLLGPFYDDIKNENVTLDMTESDKQLVAGYVENTTFQMEATGESTENNVLPESVADWIKPEDRIFFCLLNSLYGCRYERLDGWIYQCTKSYVPKEYVGPIRPIRPNIRVGVWKKDTRWFIGCRGTTVGGQRGFADLLDDYEISGVVGSGTYYSLPNCEHTLAIETKAVLQNILALGVPKENIMLGGHSLGGFTALCIATQFGLKCVGFNSAAPVSNPVLIGPGRDRSMQYHIVGDLISCSLNDATNTVLRVEKAPRQNTGRYVSSESCYPQQNNPNCPYVDGSAMFGFVWPHIMERFMKRDGAALNFIDATEEDILLVRWVKELPLWTSVFKLIALRTVSVNPIPQSNRWKIFWDIMHPWTKKAYPELTKDISTAARWYMYTILKAALFAFDAVFTDFFSVVLGIINKVLSAAKYLSFADEQLQF